MSDTTPGTIPWARERLRGLMGDDPSPELAFALVHPGPPISKCRARFSRKTGGFYTPRGTEDAQWALAMNLRTLVKPAFSGNVAVLAVFYRQNLQRIDSDNLMKLVLDAGTQAGIWKDDSQVTVQGAILELDEKNPRTIFVACDCPSTLVRGEDAMTACDACGKKFFRGGKARAVARWCSRACASTLSEPVSCSHCGAEFRRTNAKTIYCSVACRGAAVSKRALAVRAARTTCRLGHDLAGENVHVLSNGARRCRACNASGARKYRSTR